MSDENNLRPEYSAELIQSGVREKYASRYKEGTNIVVIDPDLHKIFPDSESINRALRQYAEERRISKPNMLSPQQQGSSTPSAAKKEFCTGDRQLCSRSNSLLTSLQMQTSICLSYVEKDRRLRFSSPSSQLM